MKYGDTEFLPDSDNILGLCLINNSCHVTINIT